MLTSCLMKSPGSCRFSRKMWTPCRRPRSTRPSWNRSGKLPQELYFNFDVNKPLKSGSIGSVYLAKKPVERDGVELLVPVIVKVARHNLEREFQMGSLAIELMLISSQYWAPHSKLLPFLQAMADQIKEFTRGFRTGAEF